MWRVLAAAVDGVQVQSDRPVRMEGAALARGRPEKRQHRQSTHAQKPLPSNTIGISEVPDLLEKPHRLLDRMPIEIRPPKTRMAKRLAWPRYEFTEDSPGLHHVAMWCCQGPPAMKENIVIPIKIERVKLWACWTLEATSWLICLGLLAASVVIAAGGTLAWLVAGSEIMLTFGLGGGLLLGLAGVWHLLRRLDRAVRSLRHETAALH